MRPVIPRLQRYIFFELLRVFLLVLVVLTVLLVFVGVFQKASDEGLGPLQLLQVLPYLVPSMLPFTIPATLLLTVCVVYGRISGDHEVTAAKAAGISVVSLLMPAFFLGAVLSVGSLLMTDQVIPWAEARILRTLVSAVEEIFLDRLRTEHQLRYKPKRIDITVTDVVGRRLIHPVFRRQGSNGHLVTIEAEEAFIEFDLDAGEAILSFRNCRMDLPTDSADVVNQLTITDDEIVTIPLDMNHKQTKPRHLNIRQIEDELMEVACSRRKFEQRRDMEAAIALTMGEFDRLVSPSFATNAEIIVGQRRHDSLRTEFHSRYALACSCLFFVLLGGPFAIMLEKNQFLTSFLFCFGPIVGVYYPLVLGLMTQAKRGHLNPTWAVWVGNLVMLIAAGYAMRRALKH